MDSYGKLKRGWEYENFCPLTVAYWSIPIIRIEYWSITINNLLFHYFKTQLFYNISSVLVCN